MILLQTLNVYCIFTPTSNFLILVIMSIDSKEKKQKTKDRFFMGRLLEEIIGILFSFIWFLFLFM